MNFYQKNNLGLCKLVFDSINNEIALESHIANKLSKPIGFLPFKVLQFSSIFSKPSFFYFTAIYFFCFFVVLFQFLISVFIFGFYIISVCMASQNIKNLIISSTSYHNITKAAIDQLNLSQDCFSYASITNLVFIVNKNRLVNFFPFLISFIKYTIHNAKNPFLFFLNYIDLFKSYLLSVYLIDNPEVVVVTEDHYQRFAFIVSNLGCSNFVIVQHGFIDDSIKFPSKFGKIDNLLLRDMQFLKSFQMYYKVINYSLLLRNTASIFSQNNLGSSCFLVSSSPFIDSEIKFAEFFKNNFNIKLIIKKHPAHIYNKHKLRLLLNFADEVWLDQFYLPNSSLFVSHSSFLEFDYKAAGASTFKLSNYVSLDQLFEDPLFNKAAVLIEKHAD